MTYGVTRCEWVKIRVVLCSISFNEYFVFRNSFHLNVFLWVKPTRSQHWLTHWRRVTHICVSKLTIIGSDNGLSPDWRQAIIWTNAGILLIGPLGTNFGETLIEILTFSFKQNAYESIVCETAAILSRPQCIKVIFGVLHHQNQHWPKWVKSCK